MAKYEIDVVGGVLASTVAGVKFVNAGDESWRVGTAGIGKGKRQRFADGRHGDRGGSGVSQVVVVRSQIRIGVGESEAECVSVEDRECLRRIGHDVAQRVQGAGKIRRIGEWDLTSTAGGTSPEFATQLADPGLTEFDAIGRCQNHGVARAVGRLEERRDEIVVRGSCAAGKIDEARGCGITAIGGKGNLKELAVVTRDGEGTVETSERPTKFLGNTRNDVAHRLCQRRYAEKYDHGSGDSQATHHWSSSASCLLRPSRPVYHEYHRK